MRVSPMPACLLYYLVLLTLRTISAAVKESITFTDGVGNIYSPNYPNDYPPNLDLHWLIAAGDGQRIRIHPNDFVMERLHDLLQFYDSGAAPKKRPFAELTGRCTQSHPDECLYEDIISPSNIVRIRFTTDHSNQCQGFNLTYAVV